MGLFNRKPDVAERVAEALERLVALYELDLVSRGLVTRTGQEEGEVFDTDPEEMALQERYDELRALHGLPPGVYPSPVKPDGTGWRAGDDPSGYEPQPIPVGLDPFAGWHASWDFPVGPEGAEEASDGTEEERSGAGGVTPVPEGRRSEEEQEG